MDSLIGVFTCCESNWIQCFICISRRKKIMQSMRNSDQFLNSYYLALLYGKEDQRDNSSIQLLLRRTGELQKRWKLKKYVWGGCVSTGYFLKENKPLLVWNGRLLATLSPFVWHGQLRSPCDGPWGSSCVACRTPRFKGLKRGVPLLNEERRAKMGWLM